MTSPETVQPPQLAGEHIAGVVEYYARTFPDRKPPLFRYADVQPMLAGTDREYEAACVLFDADRVHYLPGEEL